jgi:hypothetical protein
MSNTMTLLQLRTAVRNQADMTNSQFVTDAELNGYINQSIYELWDLMVQADQNFGVTSTTFTITSGNTQNLPADFYRLKGVDDLTLNANNPLTVRKFSFNERNDYAQNGIFYNRTIYSQVAYNLVGMTLMFEPPERAPGTYKLWYVTIPTSLSADGDTFDGINGWHQYIIYDSAIKCRIKEETATDALQGMKGEQRQRILAAANTRDNSQGEKITRVAKNTRNRMFYPYNA